MLEQEGTGNWMGTAYSTAASHQRPESNRVAEWVLFGLQTPGQELRPAGILLVNKQTDQLYLSLRELLPDEEDEDLAEIWAELGRTYGRQLSKWEGAKLLIG